MRTIIKDQAQVQGIRNSIAEGTSILRSGKSNGRKLSPDEMFAVRKSVFNAEFKLAESNICFNESENDFAMVDVTPTGYGPTF